MSIKPLFADPNLLHLERVSSEPDRITIIVKTKRQRSKGKKKPNAPPRYRKDTVITTAAKRSSR